MDSAAALLFCSNNALHRNRFGRENAVNWKTCHYSHLLRLLKQQIWRVRKHENRMKSMASKQSDSNEWSQTQCLFADDRDLEETAATDIKATCIRWFVHSSQLHHLVKRWKPWLNANTKQSNREQKRQTERRTTNHFEHIHPFLMIKEN